ncbi:MAG: gene transfer agent family protein [Pseudomonadota bacterium]
MANRHRGEIDAVFDGKTYSLCLTLGALAELETAFGHDSMVALAERFASGRLGARDAIRVIGAGLRGAGHDISDDVVATMRAENGVAGCVSVVAQLLSATFGEPGDAAASPPSGQRQTTKDAEPREPDPFPGPTS